MFNKKVLSIAKIHPDAVIPSYGEHGEENSGFDFVSVENRKMVPGERAIISTGLKMEIPTGYEVQVRPRSGFAIKKGVTVLNAPGTVDAGYRGEAKIILINLSDEDVFIQKGDRIAQGVFAKVEHALLVEVKENDLSDTSRGAGGFGSTGR